MKDINNGAVDSFDFTFGASTPNGANIFFAAPTSETDPSTGAVKYGAATVYIDVNGTSTPNKFGRDVFAFVLSSDGHLYAYGTENAAKELGIATTNTWDNESAASQYKCSGKDYNGLGCSARVQQENYHVNY